MKTDKIRNFVYAIDRANRKQEILFGEIISKQHSDN